MAALVPSGRRRSQFSVGITFWIWRLRRAGISRRGVSIRSRRVSEWDSGPQPDNTNHYGSAIERYAGLANRIQDEPAFIMDCLRSLRDTKFFRCGLHQQRRRAIPNGLQLLP